MFISTERRVVWGGADTPWPTRREKKRGRTCACSRRSSCSGSSRRCGAPSSPVFVYWCLKFGVSCDVWGQRCGVAYEKMNMTTWEASRPMAYHVVHAHHAPAHADEPIGVPPIEGEAVPWWRMCVGTSAPSVSPHSMHKNTYVHQHNRPQINEIPPVDNMGPKRNKYTHTRPPKSQQNAHRSLK